MRRVIKSVIHRVTNIRSFQEKIVKNYALGKKNLSILEIGSGKKVGDNYPYSFISDFDESNDFVQTDINPEFGHKILDATNMNEKNKYDLVLCLNVLEHVYEFQKVVDNLHDSLTKNGVALFSVPFIYPLHDEPGDFWRFTEHSVKRMFSDYSSVKITKNGKRQFAYCYFIEAKK